MRFIQKHFLIIGLIAVVCGVLSVSVVLAQNSEDEVCAVLVRQAVEANAEVCDAIQGSSICYVHDQVQVEAAEGAEVSFSVPGDITALEDVRTVTTSRLNPNRGRWGIAVINLPLDDEETDVVRLTLLGDVTMTNISSDGITAFTFITGETRGACKSQANKVLLQGAQDTQYSLILNAATLVLGDGAAVVLDATANGVMTIQVLNGSITVEVRGESLTLTIGEQAALPLGGEDGLTAELIPGEVEAEELDAKTLQFLPLRLLPTVVEIPALDRWTATGVELEAGQPYVVIAAELVKTIDYMPWSAPEGHSVRDCAAAGRGDWDCKCRTLPDWGTCTVDEVASMTLLGRIGESGEPFIVGAGGFFTAKADGELFLGPNDNTFTDNVGAYYAFVISDLNGQPEAEPGQSDDSE